jgi:hypothetical protein
MKKTLLVALLLHCFLFGYGQNITLVTDPAFTDAINESRYEGEIFTRKYTITNTSGSVFSGKIGFKDNFGTALNVSNLSFTASAGAGLVANWLDGGGVAVAGPDFPTTIATGNNYILNVTNFGNDERITFTERIQVASCLSGGAGKTEVVNATLNTNTNTWVPVGGNFVTDVVTGNQINILDRLITTPLTQSDLAITRTPDFGIRPRPTCTYTTGGTTGKRHFTYTVGKTTADNSTLKNLQLFLSVSQNDQTVISRQSLVIKKYQNGNVETLVISDIVESNLFVARDSASCISRGSDYKTCDAFTDLVLNLGDVKDGISFTIDFDEYYCCDNANFKVHENYDWLLHFKYDHDCGVRIDQGDYGERGYVKSIDYNGFYTQKPVSMFGPRPGTQPETANFIYYNKLNPNGYEFFGPQADEGFVYSPDNGRLIIVLKYQQGLNYTAFDPVARQTLAGSWYDFEKVSNPNGPYLTYPNLHYRSRDNASLQWHPINKDGILPAGMSYTFPDISGYKNNQTKTFVFNLNEFPLFNGPQSTYGVKNTLYDYITNSDLVYTLESECPGGLSHYKLDFYFVPDITCPSECVLPLSQNVEGVQINCPGCQFPGGAGDFCSLERQTLGLADVDNDRLPDTGALVDPGVNSDGNLDNNIRLDAGIIGDEVRFHTQYYLTDGGQACKGSDGNIGAAGPSDLTFGPLAYSYLDVSFPYGQNFTLLPKNNRDMTIKIHSPGGAITEYLIPVNQFNTIVTVENIPNSRNALYFFDLSIDKLKQVATLVSGTPLSSYISKDRIEIEFFLTVTTNETSGDPFTEIGLGLLPYFSPSPQDKADLRLGQGQGNVADQLHCVNVPGNNDGQYSNWLSNPNWNSDFNNTKAFICEGYYGSFYLAGVNEELAGWTNTFGNQCNQGIGYTNIKASIGKNINNLFRNEYRPSPLLTNIQVAIPDGWTFGGLGYANTPTEITSYISYVDQGVVKSKQVYYYIDQTTLDNVQNSVAKRRVGNFTIYDLPINYQQVTEGNINSIPTFSNQLIGGDEETNYFYWLGFVADCKNLTQDLTPLSMTDPLDKNALIFRGLGGIFEKREVFDLNNISLGRPNATLELRGFGAGKNISVSDGNYEQDFQLVNIPSSLSQAQNIFIAVVPDANTNQFMNGLPQIYDASDVLLPETAPGSGIYTLNSLNIGTGVTFKIKSTNGHGSFISCNENSSFNLNLVYGWDCNRYPTDLSSSSLSSVCNFLNDAVKLNTDVSSWEALPIITAKTTCNEINYAYSLKALEAGIKNVKFNLTFDNGVDLKANSLSVNYGNVLFTKDVDYTLTPVTGSPGAYQVVINNISLTPPFKSDKYDQDHTDLITLNFTSSFLNCSFANNSDGVVIEANAASFCNRALPALRKEKLTDLTYTLCNPCNPICTLTVNAGFLGNVCEGTVVAFQPQIINPGVAPYTYHWSSNPGTWTSDLFNGFPIVQPNTTYSVYVTDAAGCKSNVSDAIGTVTPFPKVTILDPGIVCLGTDVVLTADGSDKSFTYTWYRDGAVIANPDFVNASDPTAIKIHIDDQSTHFYKVNVANAICSIMSDVLVLNVDLLTVSAGFIPFVCEGTVVSFQPQLVQPTVGPYAYHWSSNPGTWTSSATNPSVAVEPYTTYSLYLTDGNGCRSNVSNAIGTVNPNPMVSISSPTATVLAPCNPTVTLNANPSTYISYQWFNSTGFIPGATSSQLVVSTAGWYYVIARDANGCEGTSGSIQVIDDITITGSGSVCEGQRPSMTVDVAGVLGPYNIQWFPDGTEVVSGVTKGKFYAILVFEIRPQVACTLTTKDFLYDILPLPAPFVVTADRTNICPGEQVHLHAEAPASSDPAIVDWSWSTGETTYDITVNYGGSFSVTGEGANGCFSTSNAVEVLVPIISITQHCIDASTTLLTANLNVTGNNYVWTDASNTQIGTGPSITVTSDGTYTVSSTDLICNVSTHTIVCRNTNANDVGTNLVTGGDFDMSNLAPGATGCDEFSSTGNFVSDLTCITSPVSQVQSPGKIAVTNNAANWNASGLWQPVGGYPKAGTDNFFLLADGAVTTLDQRVWSTKVDVENCASYFFKAEIRNVIESEAEIPLVSLRIKTANGTSYINGKTVYSSQRAWIELSGTWKSNITGQAEISVMIEKGGFVGRDVGIDEIEFSKFICEPSGPCKARADGIVSEKTICAGESIQIGESNPVAGITYAWSDPSGFTSSDPNPVVSPTVSTVYTLVLIDPIAGCTLTKDVKVNINTPSIVIDSRNTDPCHIEFFTNQFSGVGMVQYAWYVNGVMKEQNATGLFHPVGIKSGDVVKCQLICSCTIQPFSNEITIANQVATINAGPDVSICTAGGSAQLQATGASTYSWSPAAGLSDVNISNPVASPTVTTTYMVTGTVSNGCILNDEVVVSVGTPPAPPTLSYGSFCTGQTGLISVEVTGAGVYPVLISAPFSVSYGGSGHPGGIAYFGMVSSVDTDIIAGAVSAEGCTTLVTMPGLVHPAISNVIATANPQEVCSGGSVQLDAFVIGGTAPFVYEWYEVAGTPFTSALKNPVAIPGGTRGFYNLNVTDAYGCAGGSYIVVPVISAPEIPSVFASGPTTFCDGGNVELSTPTTGVTYQWVKNLGAPDQTFIQGANDANYIATTSGNYTLLVSNGGCSAQSGTITVTVNPAPAVPVFTPAGALSFCQGSGIRLVGPAGFTYQWNLNGTPIAGAISRTYTATAGGDYSLTVFNANHCGATSVARTVIQNPLPSMPATPTGITELCLNSPNTAYATTGALNATSYVWNVRSTSGATAGTITGGGLNGTVDWNNTFSGNVIIRVGGVNSCGRGPISTALGVRVRPGIPGTPGAPTGPRVLCINSANSLYATAGVANASSYIWTITPAAGTITGTGVNATVDWNDAFAGTATVSVRAVNGCGSGTTASSVNVTISNPPITPGMPVGPSTVCQNGANTTYTAPVANATSYLWAISPATAGTITNTGIVNWSNTFTGIANITVRSVNVCGTSTDSPALTVAVNAIPGAPILSGLNTLCVNPANGTYQATGAATSYTWTINPVSSGTIISTANAGSQITIDWNNSFIGRVTLSAIGHNPACSNGLAGTFAVIISPSVPAIPTIPNGPTSVCFNSTNSTYTTTAARAITYNWTVTSVAGTIVPPGTGASAGVDWNNTYIGSASIRVSATNGCGTSALSPVRTVNVTGTPCRLGVLAGLSENDWQAELYPNPSSSEVNLEILNPVSEKVKLVVIDMTGRIMYENDEVDTDQVHTFGSDLPSGIYIVKISAKGDQKIIKLVITR